MSNLEVFYRHKLIGEFPADHDHSLDGGDLIVSFQHKEVQRYADGKWHAAGVNIGCGFIVPDEKCPRCHPKL